MKVIGVDVGGTFTDFVYRDMETGIVAIHKVSTTPDDPSRAIVEGVIEICAANGVSPDTIAYVLHGTTTATNAVLEHTKARRSGQCMFRVDGELRSFETTFYRRHLLPVDEALAGPAVVLQKDSTTIVPPGWSAVRDRASNVFPKIGGGA